MAATRYSSPSSPGGHRLSRRLDFRLRRWLSWLGGVLVFSFVFMVYFFLRSSPIIIDESYGVTGPPDHNNWRLLARTCAPDTDICYVVVDILNDEENSYHRGIYVEGFESEFDSYVVLKHPEGIATSDSDSRLWAVDHLQITVEYIVAMLVHLFASQALALDDARDAASNVLFIGLGGGCADMFLHSKRPRINITVVELDPIVVDFAEKWFDTKDDSTRTTVIADGAKFIRQAKAAGRRFNAIVLDACDTDPTYPCPAGVFREPDVIQDMRDSLTTMGALVINVLTIGDEEEEVVFRQRVMPLVKQMTRVFPTCYSMRMQDESNFVVTCLPYALATDETRAQERLFAHRLEVASQMLGVEADWSYKDLVMLGTGSN